MLNYLNVYEGFPSPSISQRDSYGFPLGFLGAKIPSIPMVDGDHYDPLPWQVAGAGIDVETSISAQQDSAWWYALW